MADAQEITDAAEWIAAEYYVRLEDLGIRLTELDVAKLESKIRAEIREMLAGVE
jgi:hypothetical protein